MTRTVHGGQGVSAIELFGGFGGTGQGIHRAGAEVVAAANHLPIACENYAANFPTTDVYRADLVDPDAGDYVDPASLPYATVLFASPSCKHHSLANSRREYLHGPRLPMFMDEQEEDEAAYATSERSRVSMMAPLRYASKHCPELVFIENVNEVVSWGQGGDGSTFLWWLKEWKKLGYDYRLLSLNSQFFPPTPQSRDRLYIVCWRKDNTAPDLDFRPTAYCTSEQCGGVYVQAVQIWKGDLARGRLGEPVGKYQGQYGYRCPTCRQKVVPLATAAATAIDWSNLGIRIGDREKPLAINTIARIRRALAKFSGHSVVMPVKSVFGSDRVVEEPFCTLTSQQDKSLVVPMPSLIYLRGGSATGGQRPVSEPTHTVTAGGLHHGLAIPPDTLSWIEQYMSQPVQVHEQFATITSHSRHALVSVSTRDVSEVSDAEVENVRFRMLDPDPELRRAMGFENDYRLLGTKREITAGLGNAVTPPVATAIAERMFATLRGR